MKALATSLLIISYAGIVVFGVFGMHTPDDMRMVDMRGHEGMPTALSSNCLGALANGVNCPEEIGLINFVNFHINTLREFSQATLGENRMIALLPIFVVLFFVALAFLSLDLLAQSQPAFYRYRFRDVFSPPGQQQLTRWLALHENSPAFA